MQSFIQKETEILESLRGKSADEIFDHAVNLAYRLIDANRVGRAMDRAINECLEEQNKVILYKEAMQQAMMRDEFFDDEKEFCERFCMKGDLDD